jgi:dTDP-4-amino-4,6-dideoxygalactose transaminase
MTELSAALGLSQLKQLPDWLKSRRSNAAYYAQHLTRVITPTVAKGHNPAFQLYTIRSSRRDALQRALKAEGVDARIYYAPALNRQPAFVNLGLGRELPQTDLASQEVLSLPVHPALTAQQLETVTQLVNRYG